MDRVYCASYVRRATAWSDMRGRAARARVVQLNSANTKLQNTHKLHLAQRCMRNFVCTCGAPTVCSLSLGSSNGTDVPPHRQRAWPVNAFGLATVTHD